YEPLRTLTFTDSGATIVDAGANAIEEYQWTIGQSEALLVANKLRSGELIRSLTYKDQDHLDYIQDAVGGRISFGYDGSGHLSTVTDAAQRTTQFTVDATGNLREVIYPSGEARGFDYQDFRMVSSTHPNGEVSVYTYAPDGTLKTAVRPGGGVTSVEAGFSRGARYDSAGRIYYESLITDDRGVQHTLSLNAAGAVFEDKYTADGQAYDITNEYAEQLATPGSTFEVSTNRLLRFSQTKINGLATGSYTTYDFYGRPNQLARVPPPTQGGFSLAPNFDANQRLSRLGIGAGGIDMAYSYDSAGHLTKIADVFNGFGNQFPETGRRTLFAGFRAQDAQPTTITAHGIATTLGYDAHGLLSSVVDTVGRSMSVTHDAAGNPLSVADGATTLHYGYDLAGRVTSITDAENNTTQINYQTAGCNCSNGDRVTSIATPDLAPDQKWAMTYSADGDLQSATTPLNEKETYAHNAQRDLVAIVDRADRTTTFSYDQLGRRSTITDPAGRVGTFSYSRATASGWSGPTLYAQSQTATPATISLTAPLGDGEYQVGTNGFQVGADSSHVDLYRDATFQSSQWLAMDRLDRLQARTDRSSLAFDSVTPGPGTNSDVQFVNAFYGRVSPFGFLSSVSTWEATSQSWSTNLTRDPELDLTKFDATFLGRATSVLSANSAISISRDPAGRLTGVSLGPLGSSTIKYLANGQLDSISVGTPVLSSDFTGSACSAPNGAVCNTTPFCTVQTSSCTYGQCRIAKGSQTGKCLSYFNSAQTRTEQLQYDTRGLVSIRSIPLASDTASGTIQYGYDRVGRNVLLVFPDGHQRVQTFDALGRLTSRCYQYTDGTPDHCYTAQYDRIGNPTVLTDPGMRQEVGYDTLARVTSVSRFVPANATNAAYVEHYAYNALGSFSVYDGAVVDDQRARLSGGGKASAGIPASYAGQPVTLDNGGRVTFFNGQTFQYYRVNHNLQTRTTSADKQSFTYDALQRLTNTHSGPPNDQKPNSDETYVYRDLSDSISAVVTSPHTVAVPPAAPDLPVTTFNVGYDGMDHPLWMTIGTALLYFELDAVGNVRRVHTDATVHGSLAIGDLGGYSYTAFGKTIAPNDVGGIPAPLGMVQPFGWQGKRLIAPNLYDSRARVWSADLGAFLQPDEYLFLSRGGTLWSWPGQNPFKFRDRYGRGAAESLAVEILEAASKFSPLAGGAANDNAIGEAAASEEAAGLTPLGAALLAAASLGIFADQVQSLAQEMYEQQDANANAIARAAAAAKQAAGGAGEPPDGPDCKGKTHGHHSDPKFLGGDENQPLTEMCQEEHEELHRRLNEFLQNERDGLGNNMRPTRANPGRDIRENFSREERLDALRRFYEGPGKDFSNAARDFFLQHP
ncbi:MAG TPA: hypothetical protein VFK05_07660, partial [Polyangiaceae bacterium]|nr:hypothetical protein [Polyangiaceae bacterium]